MDGSSNDFVEVVRRVLSTRTVAGAAKFFPTVLLERPNGIKSWSSLGTGTSADWALAYYTYQGFMGERTRMNLFGYPGLLRDLSSPPPWVEVEPEDVDGDVEKERAAELRPLVEHAVEYTVDALVSAYRSELDSKAFWMKHNFGQASSPDVLKSSLDSFRELVAFAKVLGLDAYYAIFEAVFSFDEFTIAEGTPDLLIWLPHSDSPCWFFSEVKAPGDSLRQSQKAWLRQHWDLVRGHYLITMLE